VYQLCGSAPTKPTCNAAQTLIYGQCVNKQICDAYQKEVNGVCVADCTSAQDWVNGVCVATCAYGQTRQNGECVSPQPTCYAPQVPQNGQCVTPQPVANSSITVSVEDACNDGYAVEYRFFDTTNGLSYPSHTTSYSNTVYTHTLKCVSGATIAVGARTGNKNWGVGISNNQSCSNCAYSCDGRTYQTYRFGCSASGGGALRDQLWRTVSSSGAEKTISGDTMNATMSSWSVAQSTQNSGVGTPGKVSNYVGCGTCGVGSTITFTVTFSNGTRYNYVTTRIQ